MSVLPSPVPHPLDFSPFDVPGWAREALEWVVGFDWPAGNEVTTWDVADRWYSLTTALIEPNEAAMSAAGKFLSGYGGEGITAEGFEDAWRMVAGDENAPLHDLLKASGELGQLVEGCGADIEAAKLEAWIEIGIFLIELVGMAVSVALTLGAASPAAGGLIVATRLAIQQIFKRLVEQLGKKALKQTAGRAIKQVTSRGGLRKLGREALDEGFDEAREEIATNGGIQLYQQSTGRSHGFDFDNLGRAALAGFAGGAAATGAHAGSHGHGGVMRGAGGEVLAEFGAAASFGQLPDAAGIAKSATSGAAGSAIHGMPSSIDIGHELPNLKINEPFASTPASLPVTSGVAPVIGLDAGPVASPTADQGPSLSTPDPTAPDPTSPDAPPSPSPSPESTAPPAAPAPSPSVDPSPSAPPPPDSSPSASSPSDSSPSAPSPSAPSSIASSPSVLPPSVDPSSPASPPLPSPSDSSTVLSSTTTLTPATTAAAPLVTMPAPVASPLLTPSPTGAVDPTFGPFPAFRRPPTKPGAPQHQAAPPSTRRSRLSDLDRIADALGPRPAPRPIPRQRTNSAPRTTPRPQPTAEVRDEQAYFGYAAHARQTHEQNRRGEYADYLSSIADDHRAKILDLGHRADQAGRAGYTLRSAEHRRQAAELSQIVAEIDEQIGQVRAGTLAPARVEVDPPEWSRINRDVGNLAPGAVRTGDRSALDGFSGRPPIDRTRHYNVVGGLRAPLAVHQIDLENAVPRDSQGRVSRFPDPREGTWFGLANDGGPAADPTRGLNCVDGVLSLYETYTHGRPRVAAPRTFDVYAHGNPDRPLGGELNGVERIRLATGGDFQGLCPYLGDADPAQSKPAMDLAVRNLTNHLLNTGHGAYAFILTDLEGGGSHSWAALNHHGTVLYLDPQIGRVSEHTPMYHHHGVSTPTNIVSLEALVVDATGTPTPLPHHGPGNWSAEPPTGIQEDERAAFESLAPDQRAVLTSSIADSNAVADRVSTDLHNVVHALKDEGAHVVDEEYRIKSVESLGRKYLEKFSFSGVSPETYLSQVKDRVRFSVETPESDYGATVTRVLAGLHRLRYQTTQTANFWADHGRHNGLNVWLIDPDGFRIEIQFPTPLSRSIGKETHDSYEIMRFDGSRPWDRVDAFLKILLINKERGIYDRRPSDLHLIDLLRTKATTLAGWLRSDRQLLEGYRGALSERGISFQTHLRQHGLRLDDVPGMEEVGLF